MVSESAALQELSIEDRVTRCVLPLPRSQTPVWERLLPGNSVPALDAWKEGTEFPREGIPKREFGNEGARRTHRVALS